jgi:predicted amidophosphoribosyltransferase
MSNQLPLLAHRDGLSLMLDLLMQQGAMCSKCGHATRATSKRWAVCKKCGERVERHALPNDQDQTRRGDKLKP